MTLSHRLRMQFEACVNDKVYLLNYIFWGLRESSTVPGILLSLWEKIEGVISKYVRCDIRIFSLGDPVLYQSMSLRYENAQVQMASDCDSREAVVQNL